MKKPTKTPQKIRESSTLMDIFTGYSPEDLEEIASQMRDLNIESISIEPDEYSYAECHETRLETEKEAEVRYHKELKKWEKWKENEEKKKVRRKEKLIKEAQKLGLKVEESF